MSAPSHLGIDGFEALAKVEDVPEGALLAVKKGNGDEVCLFNARGSIGAVHNVCTHAEFPMSDGQLLQGAGGCAIECAWHGAQFDCRNGEVRRGPAIDSLPVYEVRVEDGMIWVGARK
jgi:3-phenylpropionate/trans-cinnamate dioxygenase ferredoxin subunit